MKLYKDWIIIVVAFLVVFVLIYLAVINSPTKFFSDHGNNGGINLVRDDHEFGVYYERIGYYFDKEIPFASDRVEYPILGLFYLTVPALFVEAPTDYNIALTILNLFALLLLTIVTNKILDILAIKKSRLWLFLLPSFLYFTINRFDIFPALLIQVAILLMLKKKFNWMFLFLSLSFLAKGYAMVLWPVFLIYYLLVSGKSIKNYFSNKPLLIFVLPPVMIIFCLILWAGFENALFPYIFQSSRNFAYGSIYGIFITMNWDYFANVFWRWFMSIGAKLLSLMQLLLPLAIYLGYKRFKEFIKKPSDVINWSFLVLSLYIFLSPYYSPQWFVWLLPLLILIPLNYKEIWWIVIYDLLNFIFFPIIFSFFGHQHILFDLIVFIRTILFIVLILLVAKKVINSRHQELLKKNINY